MSDDKWAFNPYRVLIIIGAGLLITLPCLIYGFPFYGDDSSANAVYATNFGRQFRAGDFFPRWLQALNGGLGSAVTYYYPPFAYWTTSLLNFGAEKDPFGWRPLGMSASAAVIASGLTVYLWLAKTVDRRAALVASLTYLILPYHIALDLYQRGALAELWTFVWMPVVLWAVDGLIVRRRFAALALALSYALLVLTHLPTTLIFSLVPLAYSLTVAPVGKRRTTFLLTTAAMTLGVGLAAIYLIPAIAMQEFIFHTTEGISGHYYFGSWFLFSNLGWSGNGSEYFQSATGVLLAAVVAVTMIPFGPTSRFRKSATFWFAVVLIWFFMMTPLSKPIWIWLPTLQKVQFPFRFNTVLSLAIAPLIAFAAIHFKKRSRWSVIGLVIILLLAGCSMWGMAMRAYYAYPVHHVDEALLDAYNTRLMQRRDTNEFRPRWVVSVEAEELDALLQRIGEIGGELNKASIIQGDGVVSVEEWTPRRIVLRTNTQGDAVVNVSQFYFPGWFLTVDDLSEKHAVQPSKPGGLIRVLAPAGQHRLTLQLGKRTPEIAGELITLTAALIFLLLAFYLYFFATQPGSEPTL